MSLVVVDIEADGPIPHKYSMVCFGAVVVEPTLTKRFYGQVKPISDLYVPEALAVSGFSRAEHEGFDDPSVVMADFKKWLGKNTVGSAVFVSDNVAFDWQWINYYFHFFLGKNPFGHSGRRIGDLYAGMQMDIKQGTAWKSLRRTSHDHNPVNDALGNAEALLKFHEMGLKMPLV